MKQVYSLKCDDKNHETRISYCPKIKNYELWKEFGGSKSVYLFVTFIILFFSDIFWLPVYRSFLSWIAALAC